MSLLENDLGGRRQWATVRDGYDVTKKPRWLNRSDFDAIPFAAMEAIPQGGAFAPEFTIKAPNEIASGTYFEKGDILVGKITPSFENGKQGLIQTLPAEFGYATTEVIPLHPVAKGHDPRFLFYYLLHPDVRQYVTERMEGSTGRKRVPEGVLLDLPVPDFAPREQMVAADALERIQAAIAKEENCLTTAQALKRAAMRALFTKGLKGEPQKETPIGPIPESWELVEFSEVRNRLQYGTSTRCTYEATSQPVLRIPNIEAGRVEPSDIKFASLREKEADRYLLENGDLIFIRTNGVIERLGACAVFAGQPEGSLFASYLIRAQLNLDRVDPYFVAYFYASDLGASIVAGRATPAADGKYNLNTGTIDGLPLPLPPTLDEQREIVAILSAIDAKIDLHREKRAVLDELFRALLHKLMTGEIAVTDLNLDALTPNTEAAA